MEDVLIVVYMHVYIVYVHLPTGIPDIPIDFHEVNSSCDPEYCIDVYEWSFSYKYSHSFGLIFNGHLKIVPQDKMYYYFRRRRQESGNVSLVLRNPCGQSKTSDSLYYHGKHCELCAFMNASYWSNCLCSCI